MLRLEPEKLKLWSIVCILSAIPSFYWAYVETKANIPAMVTGIILFILIYTAATSSDVYKKIKTKIYLYKALKIAFKIRIFYSLLCIISIIMARNDLYFSDTGEAHFVNLADGYAGLISCFITELLLDKPGIVTHSAKGIGLTTAFLPALITTINQGIILTIIILLLALIIWCFFRIKILCCSKIKSTIEQV